MDATNLTDLEVYAVDTRVSIISREFHLQWCRSQFLLAQDYVSAKVVSQLLSELHHRERKTA